jgi:hypothetical protein
MRSIPGRVFVGGAASIPHAAFIEAQGGVFLGAHLGLGMDKLLRRLKCPE